MATIRAKKLLLEGLYTQFKMHGLTTDVNYTDYVSTVGAGEALARRTLKACWGGRWPRVMSQLQHYYPDVNTVVNKIEKKEEKSFTGLEDLKKVETDDE